MKKARPHQLKLCSMCSLAKTVEFSDECLLQIRSYKKLLTVRVNARPKSCLHVVSKDGAAAGVDNDAILALRPDAPTLFGLCLVQ